MEHGFAVVEKILNLIERLLNTPALQFVLVSLFIVTGVLAFSPFGLRETIGLGVFHYKYQESISLLFLCSASCLSYLLSLKIIRAWRNRRHERIFLKSIESLSPKELGVVGSLFRSPSGAEWLPYDDENVMSLINKDMLMLQMENVIIRPEKNYRPCVLCALHPLVRDEIRKIERAGYKRRKA